MMGMLFVIFVCVAGVCFLFLFSFLFTPHSVQNLRSSIIGTSSVMFRGSTSRRFAEGVYGNLRYGYFVLNSDCESHSVLVFSLVCLIYRPVHLIFLYFLLGR